MRLIVRKEDGFFMPNCTNCGSVIGEDFEFCPECGAKIQKFIPQTMNLNNNNSKICTNCGAWMPIDAVSCFRCGAPFVYPTMSNPNPNLQPVNYPSGNPQAANRQRSDNPSRRQQKKKAAHTQNHKNHTEAANITITISDENGSWKNKWTAFFLCLFLGWIGAHKYYEGKIGTGLLYTFTVGLCGVGWFIDIFKYACKPNPYFVKK